MTDKKDPKNLREEAAKWRLRKLTRKRWFLPAVYLGVAALILTGALVFQKDGMHHQSGEKHQANNIAINKKDKNAVPVNSMKENFKWPVEDRNAVNVVQPFYDPKASEEEQAAALVNYNHSYTQNTGIDIAAKGNKSFAVTAAMSGKVVKAEKDNLLGNVVELQHKNGVTTVYESLASMSVKPGETVSQGEEIGKAGQCEFNKDAGVHVHFEIRKDGVAVNPEKYFSKGLSSLDNVNKTNSSIPRKEMPKKPEGKDNNENVTPNKDNNMKNPNESKKGSTDQSSDNSDVSSSNAG
ncbi:stage II sporulation protein Q [Scopulibacillus daqui]|uniref:Stage II sporulation protein Q n=1 Tax=Scopulibacillus daqui TaxID=1469162 RepID=A0ABS2PZ84_9BACL|nr:M23 family metallopeptidase [Scopulibacillus daqui]MBM7645354.1 stage II sporulation protein Q [Scopulibacillus daqui]